MKLIQIILLSLSCYSLQAQESWFIGGRIAPQHSYILNKNDRLAENYPNNLHAQQNDVLNFNSVSAGVITGYRFEEWLALEISATYSYQQQFYEAPDDDFPDSEQTIRNRQHLAKLELSPLFSIPLSQFLYIDLKLGLQLAHTLGTWEERYLASASSWSKRGYKNQSYYEYGVGRIGEIDDENPMSESIMTPWNLEAVAATGLRFEIQNNSQLFFRVRADRSLFDIENKAVTYINTVGNEVSYYHMDKPFRWAYGDLDDCPDCSEERPASYNFTVGLSVGYIYHFD